MTSADAEDVILHAPPTLAALSLGNESEILIYNFNCVGWPALRTLRCVRIRVVVTEKAMYIQKHATHIPHHPYQHQ